MTEPRICDGCNVREPWEHRCHGARAVVRGQQTGLPCQCKDASCVERGAQPPHENTAGPAAARRDDAATSHEAAALTERTKAKPQREILKEFVLANPGHTHAEIAAAVGIKASNVHKRLPELRKAGLIANGETRICSISGTKMMTWIRPVPSPQGDLF